MRESPGADSDYTRSTKSGEDEQSYFTHYSDGSMGLAKRDNKQLSLVSYVVVNEGSSSSNEAVSDETRGEAEEYHPLSSALQQPFENITPNGSRARKPSFDHSSSTHKARGNLVPAASASASTSGSSLRHRSMPPRLSVITDLDREDVEEEEPSSSSPFKKVAEDLGGVYANDPTSPDHGGRDGNDFRSRRRERLARLATTHRSTSPQKQSVKEEQMDTRISRSFSPQKKVQGVLHKKDIHMKEQSLLPNKLSESPREIASGKSTGTNSGSSKKAYEDYRESAFVPTPKSDRVGSSQKRSTPKQETHVSSPKAFFPKEDDKVERETQHQQHVESKVIKKYISKRYHHQASSAPIPQTQRSADARALLEKKHANIKAAMLRKPHDPVERVGSDEYDELSPRPHRSPAVVHYWGPHSPNEQGVMSALRSQDSDETSAFTSNLQHGMPCVAQVLQSTEKFSRDANGCVGGYMQKGTSFVSGVWQSCASGIGGYQTESNKSLLQLEMIAEQSISSIVKHQQYDQHQGRRSPEAFRHSRDLLARKEEQAEEHDEDEDVNPFVRGMEDTLLSLGCKVQQVVRANPCNREQSMMDDMRNMLDSISKFAITPHHTYMGADEAKEQHKFFEYRYGSPGKEQPPYEQYHRQQQEQHQQQRLMQRQQQQQPPVQSRALMFMEVSTDEEESHHVRDEHKVEEHLEFQYKDREFQPITAASIYSSVSRGTKDRRSMFAELQRRRKKHGLVKEENEEEPRQPEPEATMDEIPSKTDAGNLRDVYLHLYDKIHDETGKSLEQLEEESTSFGEESDEEGNDYAVVWAASEEQSVSSHNRANLHTGSLIDTDDTTSEDAVQHSEYIDYSPNQSEAALSLRAGEPSVNLKPSYDTTVDGEASTSTRMFLDAHEEYQSSNDGDSSKGASGTYTKVPLARRNARDDDESTYDGPTLLPNATSTTHPDQMEDMVNAFLECHPSFPGAGRYTPLAGIKEEDQANPKIESKVHFQDDNESAGSEDEDRTLTDSTMFSGLSASSHTHELSMDETIDTLGASHSRSRSSSRTSGHSCEVSEVPPEIPHPLGPISEYQVLYQISEEDEEVETDASSEGDTQEIPFDEQGKELGDQSNRKWSVVYLIKFMLRWTMILVAANSFGFFHWLLDVPLSASDVVLDEATNDPVKIIRGASYFEIPIDDNDSKRQERNVRPFFLEADKDTARHISIHEWGEGGEEL